MAIKINNTTVIDDTKHVLNVPSITFADATVQTTAAGGGSGLGSVVKTQGELMFTLDNPNAYSTPASDYFGTCAVSGNYAIVSSINEDEINGGNSGKVYVYNITTGALVHTLNNPNTYGTAVSDNFGYALGISGSHAIIGVPYEGNPSGVYSGRAYIFNVVTGSLVHTIEDPNPYGLGTFDEFGSVVAISGNYAIVGAYNEDDAVISGSGKAYIYNVTTGALVHILNNPNAYSTSDADYFGGSVAISGNYAVVGASVEDDIGGFSSGKAYVYNVTTGALVHTLNNPNAYDTSADDNFGSEVAISGNYAAVSAYNEDDTGGTGSGKVYIFNVTTGVLLWTLNNPNAYGTSADDWFGLSIAMSGDYAIVGVYREDDIGGEASGKAYIFDVTTGELILTLNNPNAYSTSANDSFGASVAISGNYAIAAASSEDDAGGAESGKAYIFSITDTIEIAGVDSIGLSGGTTLESNHKIFETAHVQGELITTLNNPNAYSTSNVDGFGFATAISGNYAIVGAINEDDSSGANSGKAYIFNVTTGALVHTLNNPNTYSTGVSDLFGYAVAISGNRAVVAAQQEDDTGGANSGKVYVFDVVSGSLIHTISNPSSFSTSAGDEFGYSVAVSSSYVIVGAYLEDDVGGTGSGKVYIFNAATGALVRTLDNPNAYSTSDSDAFGNSVAISGNYIAVGAYNEDDAGGTGSGKVYIYDAVTGTRLWTLNNPNAYSTSASDYFGYITALSGNYLIASAPIEDDASGADSGKAYIFNVTTGALVYTFDNPNTYSTSGTDYFGFSVAISSKYAVVGAAYEDDAGGAESGKAYVYDLLTGSLILTLNNPNAYSTSTNDNFGGPLAISDNYILVGAANEDDVGGATSGKVYTYSLTNQTYFDKLLPLAQSL